MKKSPTNEADSRDKKLNKTNGDNFNNCLALSISFQKLAYRTIISVRINVRVQRTLTACWTWAATRVSSAVRFSYITSRDMKSLPKILCKKFYLHRRPPCLCMIWYSRQPCVGTLTWGVNFWQVYLWHVPSRSKSCTNVVMPGDHTHFFAEGCVARQRAHLGRGVCKRFWKQKDILLSRSVY